MKTRRSNRSVNKSNVGNDELRKTGPSSTFPTTAREDGDSFDRGDFTSVASSSILTAAPISSGKEPSLAQSRSSMFASLKHPSSPHSTSTLTKQWAASTDVPAYNIPNILAKLEHLSGVLAATARWAVDDCPGGGLSEFRATEFEKKIEMLFRMYKEVIGKAELVEEAASPNETAVIQKQHKPTRVFPLGG